MRALFLFLLCLPAFAQCNLSFNPLTGRLECGGGSAAASIPTVISSDGTLDPLNGAEEIDIVLNLTNANIWTATQVFTPTATVAGAVLACAALPSAPENGALACDSGDSNQVKVYSNGAWRTVGVVAGTVPVANGGTGITSGTSGGVLAFTAAGTIASSGALTANLPVIGGGAGVAPTVGTRSGNTTAYVTTTGTQTSGRCVEIDANGNHIAASGACGGSASAISGPVFIHGSAAVTAVSNFVNPAANRVYMYPAVLREPIDFRYATWNVAVGTASTGKCGFAIYNSARDTKLVEFSADCTSATVFGEDLGSTQSIAAGSVYIAYSSNDTTISTTMLTTASTFGSLLSRRDATQQGYCAAVSADFTQAAGSRFPSACASLTESAALVNFPLILLEP